MKLALMWAATGNEQTHLNINCSEETAWIRPSWLNCCKKPLLKETSNKKRLGLFFNRTMTQNTPPGCVRAIFPRRKVIECCIKMTWPPESPNLNPIEMVWDKLERRVKEKQPTSAQHMWELLQDCWKNIPGEAGWENAKRVQRCHQGKGWRLCRI